MEGIAVLKIGLCACSTAYQGLLAGQMAASPFPKIVKGLRFEEISIPERKHRDTLRLSRCHLFLDFHQQTFGHRKDMWLTELELIMLISNGPGRGWRMHIGGAGHFVGRMLAKEWITTESVTVTELIGGTLDLFNRMGEQKFARWLEIMSQPN